MPERDAKAVLTDWLTVQRDIVVIRAGLAEQSALAAELEALTAESVRLIEAIRLGRPEPPPLPR